MSGNILSPMTIRIGASATLDGRALSESSVIFEGYSILVLPLEFYIYKAPSWRPTSVPTRAPYVVSKMASICLISAIPARYNQSAWSGTDASEAMMQAIAISMGVPVSYVQCGYAEQLCLLSPTRAPSISPTTSFRKMQGKERLTSDAFPITSTVERQIMAITDVLPVKRLLSFSITKIIPGKDHLYH